MKWNVLLFMLHIATARYACNFDCRRQQRALHTSQKVANQLKEQRKPIHRSSNRTHQKHGIEAT